MATLALKCASRVETRDLPVRVTSNFGKMISDIKIIEKPKKNYRIRVVTAAVTSLLTQIANFSIKTHFSSPISVPICQNHFTFWWHNFLYQNNRYLHKSQNTAFECHFDVTIDFKWPVWSWHALCKSNQNIWHKKFLQTHTKFPLHWGYSAPKKSRHIRFLAVTTARLRL